MFNQELYRETFAQVQASEETLAEVLKMTNNKKNSFGRLTHALLIAAVLTAMLATTAFAYVGFTQYENPMQMLKTFFGGDEYCVDDGYTYTETYYDQVYNFVVPTEEHVPMDTKVAEENVAPYISDVGKSITDDGDILTVEAHLYDSATGCGIIYYTLKNPDGVRGYNLQPDGEVWWPGLERVVINNCFGKNFIIEEETDDTKLSVAHYYSSVYGDEGCIRVGFGNGDEFLYLPLDDGGGMGAISLADGDIRVSAIGMKIVADNMEFLRKYDTDGTYLPPMLDNIETLMIRYQDGTDYVIQVDDDQQRVKNYKYSIQNMYGDECSYSFNRLISVENVVAVIINDVEFTDIQVLSQSERNEIPETRPEEPPVTEAVDP